MDSSMAAWYLQTRALFGDGQKRSVPETVTGTGRWLWDPGCRCTPPSLSWPWLRCPEGCCSGKPANTAAVPLMSEPGTSGPAPTSSVGSTKLKVRWALQAEATRRQIGIAAYLQTLSLPVLLSGGFLQCCRVPGGGICTFVICVRLHLHRPLAVLFSTYLRCTPCVCVCGFLLGWQGKQMPGQGKMVGTCRP